ncbi:DUF6049 family protein [uncultured Georgenia sp.]|uniref:DUF6049 family protein n=1 Tax=uncultured Georgenia sp. TaxID=378209 RepID=UPI00263572C8|nr:DUF6049 family protein [uncultured Georgenia sp.]HLV04050.1 DUF6049 family protein [Actinomycetaceae bacterium]
MSISWTPSGAARRALAVLVLTVLGLLLPGLVAPTAAAPEEPADDGVTVALTGIEPAILTPGEDLVVRGTVTNDSPAALELPELRLRAQQSTPISRSLLERWLDPTFRSTTTLLHAERLEDPVEPGSTVSFTLTVPAESVTFAPSHAAWGPRGIEVTAHDAAAPEAVPAALRSFVVWWPDIEVERMPLAVLAAAAPTAAERAAARERGTSVHAVAAERLGPLLDALDRPAVDLAVDPALLVDVPGVLDLTAAQPEPASSPTDQPLRKEAPTALRSAIEGFAAGPGRTVHALLWADADAAALAHSGRGDLIERVAAARDEALAQSGLDAGTGLAWPAGERPDGETLGALAGAGAGAVVLPAGGPAVTTPLTYTPSARADVVSNGQTLPAVLADERLSRLLAGELLPVNPVAEQAVVRLDPLTARQYVLAETAVVARERPADRRDLLLTVPRGFTGDPELLAEQLTALAQAPWLERIGLEEMLDHPAPELERESLPASVVEVGEIDATELSRVSEVLARTTAFAGVLDEPAKLVDPVRASLLELTSSAWRQRPDTRAALVTAAEDAVEQRRGLVAARPGSTLNLINDEAHIPVAVTNEMTLPANVLVRLVPRDPRLVVDEQVALQIPAQQSATAQVPVHAVGSGDVVVDVVLAAPDGSPIDEPTEIRVRVRADWETVGTAVVAGLLVLLLVVGLVRTVRRGRRGALPGTEGAT